MLRHARYCPKHLTGYGRGYDRCQKCLADLVAFLYVEKLRRAWEEIQFPRAAIAQVQKSAAWGSTTLTLPADSTAGTLLVCHGSSTPVTPPAGWATVATDNLTGAGLYYYENNPGGLNNFNFSPGRGFITEWSGFTGTSLLDTSGSNAAGTSPVTATTSGNVSAANSLAVGIVGDALSKAGTTTMGAGAGWTSEADDGSNGAIVRHGLASSQLNPTSGSTLSEQGSSSSMNVTRVAVIIAVFKPTGTSSFNTQKTNQNIITNISGKRASYY